MATSPHPAQLQTARFPEESAEELYEYAPCGYLSCLPDGTLIKLNATLLQWLGYERGELLYCRRFQDLLTAGGRLYYETHFGPLLQLQGGASEVSFRLRRKDGTTLPTLVNAARVADAAGSPQLYRVTVFNVVDRDKYEQELLLAKQKAEEASQLKARFVSAVSHEIRTPLHTIQALADLLLDEADPTRMRQLKQMLKDSSDGLLALINHVLDYGKLETGPAVLEEAPVDLCGLFGRVLEPLALRASNKGVVLRTEIDAAVPAQVLADAVKLTQVLTNLVGNAIKFTEQGVVTVSLRTLRRDPASATLQVRVHDTGIGIKAAQLTRVFEEYQQADYAINLKYGGTGLGLTISQQIVALYGSRIEIRSQEGKGTEVSFVLTLQMPADLGQAPPAPSSLAALLPLPGTRVLVADDNRFNIFVLSQYLKRWQVDFDVARDGEQALQLVQAARYDLVLLDLQMPVMNGAEAVRRIRALPGPGYQQLPLVLQSAVEPAELRQLMAEFDFTDFLVKPFRAEQLHATISRYATERVPASEAAPAPAVQLATLRELTHNEPAMYAAALQLLLDNLRHFQAYCATLLTAVPGGAFDPAAFRQQTHKIALTLAHINAQAVQAGIADLKQLLEAPAGPAAIRAATASVLAQVQLVVAELQAEQAAVSAES